MIPHNAGIINLWIFFFVLEAVLPNEAMKRREARGRDSCLFERWHGEAAGTTPPGHIARDILFASCHPAELRSTQMAEGRRETHKEQTGRTRLQTRQHTSGHPQTRAPNTCGRVRALQVRPS